MNAIVFKGWRERRVLLGLLAASTVLTCLVLGGNGKHLSEDSQNRLNIFFKLSEAWKFGPTTIYSNHVSCMHFSLNLAKDSLEFEQTMFSGISYSWPVIKCNEMFTIVRRISTKLFSTFNVFVTYLGTLHYNEITPLRNIFGCAYRVVSAMRGVSENLAISEIVLYYKFCSNNIVVYVIPAFSCRLATEYNYIPNEISFQSALCIFGWPIQFLLH